MGAHEKGDDCVRDALVVDVELCATLMGFPLAVPRDDDLGDTSNEDDDVDDGIGGADVMVDVAVDATRRLPCNRGKTKT